MRFQIHHSTGYRYASPARDSFNEAHLQPIADEWQRVEWFELRTQPVAPLRVQLDFHQNVVHYFDILEPHTELSVVTQLTVTTWPRPGLAPGVPTVSASRLGECVTLDWCYEYLQPSAYVDTDGPVRGLALDVVSGIDDVWRCALALMHFVYTGFTYWPMSTSVQTHMRDVIEVRRGVCQDFAHVLLGLCRSVRIPARYVSGYLATETAGATHAWVEVFVPGFGWQALDPTHNRVPGETYVRIAVGRDYGDVAPVRGHYRGSRDRQMSVEVRITPLG